MSRDTYYELTTLVYLPKDLLALLLYQFLELLFIL